MGIFRVGFYGFYIFIGLQSAAWAMEADKTILSVCKLTEAVIKNEWLETQKRIENLVQRNSPREAAQLLFQKFLSGPIIVGQFESKCLTNRQFAQQILSNNLETLLPSFQEHFQIQASQESADLIGSLDIELWKRSQRYQTFIERFPFINESVKIIALKIHDIYLSGAPQMASIEIAQFEAEYLQNKIVFPKALQELKKTLAKYAPKKTSEGDMQLIDFNLSTKSPAVLQNTVNFITDTLNQSVANYIWQREHKYRVLGTWKSRPYLPEILERFSVAPRSESCFSAAGSLVGTSQFSPTSLWVVNSQIDYSDHHDYDGYQEDEVLYHSHFNLNQFDIWAGKKIQSTQTTDDLGAFEPKFWPRNRWDHVFIEQKLENIFIRTLDQTSFRIDKIKNEKNKYETVTRLDFELERRFPTYLNFGNSLYYVKGSSLITHDQFDPKTLELILSRQCLNIQKELKDSVITGFKPFPSQNKALVVTTTSVLIVDVEKDVVLFSIGSIDELPAPVKTVVFSEDEKWILMSATYDYGTRFVDAWSERSNIFYKGFWLIDIDSKTISANLGNNNYYRSFAFRPETKEFAAVTHQQVEFWKVEPSLFINIKSNISGGQKPFYTSPILGDTDFEKVTLYSTWNKPGDKLFLWKPNSNSCTYRYAF